MGSYFTADAVRLGLVGLGAGFFTGLVWRRTGRIRWGAAPFVLAVLAAARLTGRSDWPRWDGAAIAAAVVAVLAAAGAHRLLADLGAGWLWVAAGSLISAFGVYAAVPETGPAILAGGGLTGLAVAAVLARASWAPAAGVGAAAVLGWAASSGAAGRPWAAVGGVLCTGIAPWFALRPPAPTYVSRWRPGPWLLGVHAVLVMLAARWIGVAQHGGWPRVAVVAGGGLAVAAATRKRA